MKHVHLSGLFHKLVHNNESGAKLQKISRTGFFMGQQNHPSIDALTSVHWIERAGLEQFGCDIPDIIAALGHIKFHH